MIGSKLYEAQLALDQWERDEAEFLQKRGTISGNSAELIDRVEAE